ncbi:CoA transferase [Gordonia sp. TBRC 11910]|uniref:CoA transferase n=1 Tax=Gordonia asplenii TaxID=2725283 RepID=A0A848L2T9_9ACTN|nr:CoA transferase [Gordonia asplenii]NMO02923.1 CoA transferase [Gordonia asplenii]
MTSDLPSPLAGLRVVDLSRVLAGPYVGRIMADLGADVVKVEAPDGDQSRHFGATRAGLSGFYTQFNVGKRNVCIDLRTAQGVEVLLDLIDRADVVIENFRPGVMARLGLAPDTLLARRPSLVVLSISGFGQTGADSPRPAYASVVHAEAGLMARQATLDDSDPTDLALAVGDYNAALHGAIAVLAAVRLAEATGTGQHIDMSMFDAMVATDDYAHNYLDGYSAARVGGEIWSAPGGPIIIASVLYNTWGRLRRTFDLADGLAPDTPVAEKIATRRRLVQEWLLAFDDRADACAALDAANLVWADIRSPGDALTSPLAYSRAVAVDVDGRDGATRRVTNTPYKFSAARSGPRGPAPYRGEHNQQVLAEWLGLPGARAGELSDRMVLQEEDHAAAQRREYAR